MNEERRAALLESAREKSVWIFEDDFNWNSDGITRTDLPLWQRPTLRALST